MRHDRADVERAAQLFKALSHPSRLEIACRLADCGPKTQKELVDALGWPPSSLARHLSPLRALGIVESRRSGVEVHLKVRNPIVKNLFQSVCDWLADHPDDGAPPRRGRRRRRRAA